MCSAPDNPLLMQLAGCAGLLFVLHPCLVHPYSAAVFWLVVYHLAPCVSLFLTIVRPITLLYIITLLLLFYFILRPIFTSYVLIVKTLEFFIIIPCLQLRALSTRLLRNTYRHPFLVLLNFVASLCAAISIGLIFRDAGEYVGAS